MALSIQLLGKGISTEKYILRATTNDVAVTSVLLRIFVDGIAGTFVEVEQDPNVNNPLEFDFEISDMLRNAFEFQFLDLQAATSFSTQVVYANELFQEVIGATVLPTNYIYYTKLKNITQGVFEIESFDLLNYHLGNDGNIFRKFLTTAPIVKDLAEGESEFLTASSWSPVLSGGTGYSSTINATAGLPAVDTTFTFQITKDLVVENYSVFVDAAGMAGNYAVNVATNLFLDINASSTIVSGVLFPAVSGNTVIISALSVGVITTIQTNIDVIVSSPGSNPVASGTAQHWVIESYNNIGSLIGTVNKPLTEQLPFAGSSGLDTRDNSAIRIQSNTGVSYKLVYVADITGGTVRSETRRFDNNNSCGGVRLHWLNEFGQQDSFTFDGKVTKSLLTTFESFKRIRPVDPASTDVGDLVYKSEYGQEWAMFTRVVPPNAIEWLSKSLVNNRASIEINGKYYPIIIKDKKKVTSDSFNPVFQFAISFMFANKRKGIQ